MTSVSEIMTKGCECIGENETIATAAKKMQDLEVGSLPICGEDDRLKGMLTDRDIVIKVVAAGLDPEQTRAGQLADGKPVYAESDQSAEEAVEIMSEHQIRRLPVINADKRLVGIISQGDIATRLGDEPQTGEMVQRISLT